MLVVMALGGDIPLRLVDARRAIAAIAGEHAVVVTHSNGPHAVDARLIEWVLKKEMPGRKIASLVTDVEVRLVPVGPHYVDTPDGRGFVAALGWMVVQDGTGFRRCIPTPEPQRIIQLETIKTQIEAGVLLICPFGAGIATMESEFGLREGEVQIDEDLAAALLAEEVGADLLMLLGNVDVERVEVVWPRGAGPPLGASTDDALRRISFGPGLMGPKAEAACRFVESTGKRAAIGALAQAPEILRGDRGVQVTAKSSGAADLGGGGRSVTVLVADDNDVARRLCRRVLEKAGYKVLTASDGLEAVSLALANSPDMILLDVAMPGMDGLEAMRQIKEQRPGIAIVIASAHLLPSDRERFLALGADDMLIPPFRLSDLIAVVARLTANRGPQTKDLTGTRLGSHELVERLGGGGMADVRTQPVAAPAKTPVEGRVARTDQPTRRASPVQALREMVRMGIKYVTVKQAHDQLGEKARRQLQELNRIGIALSAERDILKLQHFILETMRQLTNADSASLWLKTVGDDGQPKLFLSASQNTSIDNPYQAFKVPVDEKSVVGYTVTVGTSQIYDDAYNPPPGKPPAGKGFDAQYGYRTKSMLTVPMRNYDNDVIGAVQLINAKRTFETKLTVDNVPDEVVSFRPEDLEMIESIASQAAVALDNKNLLDSIEALFDGFVRTSLSALELRDPTAAGHSYRVEVLTTSLAQAVSRIEVGKYRDVRLTEDQFKELRYACLLHDVGLIGVREHILIKAKKLLPGQLEVIQARFASIEASVQVKFATEKLDVMRNGKGSSQRLEDIDRRRAQEIDQLHRWMAAIVQANEPSVLPEDMASILEQLSKQTYHDLSSTPHPMLDPQEFGILSIRKGVLDPQERLEMESHVTHSFEFVNMIPWPPSMRGVPEIVFAHHEKLDGSGYPRGLAGDQISLQTRMLTIADIYDALTAHDRPYKRAVPTAVALEILRAEANEGKLDKDLLDVFVSKEVFLAASSQRSAAAKSSGTARVTKLAAPAETPVEGRVARTEQPMRRAMDADAASMSGGAGYRTLDALLHDQSVSEIMVNGPYEVFIERRGVLTNSEVRFDDENQLLETIRRMVATTGQHIDVQNPIVEGYLPDGSRVNAVIPPASNRGPALTVRKLTNTVLSMDHLTREGSLSPAMAEFLEAAVLGRLNILVSGGSGSGKTATLNVIARFIPHKQRVITIEEGPELQIDHPHVVSLLHRPADVEGKGEPTIRQLLRQSLRMRPDRILVGEVRGAEAIDMLQAMNTGQDGSMSTICSNSARDALSRLETMVRMASIDLPLEAMRAQIASAVNLIVHQARMPDGRRKIAEIAEVVGYDANGAILRDIFLLGMGSDLRLEFKATSYVPTSLDKAAFYGVQVNQDLFDPEKSRFVPVGSDSMMSAVQNPLRSGSRSGGGGEVVRQVNVVSSSPDRPGAAVPMHATAPASAMATTPEMREEMRKLIDAARSAVADLQATVSQPGPQPPASMESVAPLGIPEPPTTASTLEMQEEMRKLIDAARAAVADLQVDALAHGGSSPGPKASKRRSSRRRT